MAAGEATAQLKVESEAQAACGFTATKTNLDATALSTSMDKVDLAEDFRLSVASPPIVTAESPAPAPAQLVSRPLLKAAASDPQHPRTPFLLLVDDNAINLKLLAFQMQKSSYSYSTATNGLEALEVYAAAPVKPDIILMDISMPVMDGLTSAREIRKLEVDNGWPKSVIIAITGAASDGAKQSAFENGLDLFLAKPVPMKRLKELLEAWKTKGAEIFTEPNE